MLDDARFEFAMMYQRELKLEAMQKLGLTWEQVNVEYSQWEKIREQLEQK